jgi:hypothetical protein
MIQVLCKSAKSLITQPCDYLDSANEGPLATSVITAITELEGSKSGRAQRIILVTPTGQIMYAVWKARQEKDIRSGNIPTGTEWKRERLAYLVSQILELSNVPAVVIRRNDEGRIGSAMQFIHGDTWKASELEYADITLREWQKLAVLDWLIVQTDRHRRNWLVDDNGKFWAIDNDMSFPEKYQWGPFRGYRSRPHWYLNENNDLRILNDILRLFTEQKYQDILAQYVRYGISQNVCNIFKWRWDYLKIRGRLPRYVDQQKGFMAALTKEGIR